jgi:hypothetical protein
MFFRDLKSLCHEIFDPRFFRQTIIPVDPRLTATNGFAICFEFAEIFHCKVWSRTMRDSAYCVGTLFH